MNTSERLAADRLDHTLQALAECTRRSILGRLAQGPATAGQLAALFAISRPAVSRHLRVLRDAGLAHTTARGRHLWYEADPGGVDAAIVQLEHLSKRLHDAPPLQLREHP